MNLAETFGQPIPKLSQWTRGRREKTLPADRWVVASIDGTTIGGTTDLIVQTQARSSAIVRAFPRCDEDVKQERFRIVSPSALAVLRLRISSSFEDCSTDGSA